MRPTVPSIYSADYRRLLKELVRARKAAQLTQVEVARRLGKPQSFVSKYERGERRLDVIEFLRVARAIDIDAVALLARF